MRVKSLSTYLFGALTVAALAGFTTSAQAQTATTAQGSTGTATVSPKRAAARAKLQAMTPAERKVAKAKVRHHARKNARKRVAKRATNATPAQQQWLKSSSAENKTLRASVKAGTMTKANAAAQRKAWRQANPRPVKTGTAN